MKKKKKSRLIQAQEASKASLDSVNGDIEKLGVASSILFSSIGNMEEVIDGIKDFPEEKVLPQKLPETIAHAREKVFSAPCILA